MGKIRTYYRILRSVAFTAIIVIGVLYLSLYILVSVPGVQRMIKDRACKELSAIIGSEVRVDGMTIMPFNEVRLTGVEIFTPGGETCLKVGTLGAGIHLWRLISERKIEITYAEILDLDGKIWQDAPNSPLNIDFIIKAFSPKDKTKPPTQFDIKIHDIVIRRSRLSFDKRWIEEKKGSSKFDPAHISITDLNADLVLPVLKNDDYRIDLRRLTFKAGNSLNIRKIACKAEVTPQSISLKDLLINVGKSFLTISDIDVHFKDFSHISELADLNHNLEVKGENLNPADFSFFYPPLSDMIGSYDISVDVSGGKNDGEIRKLSLYDPKAEINIFLKGSYANISDLDKLSVNIESLNLKINQRLTDLVTSTFLRDSGKIREYVSNLGDISINSKGRYNEGIFSADLNLSTSLGDLSVETNGNRRSKIWTINNLEVSTEELNIGGIINKDILGHLSCSISGDGIIRGKDIDGNIECDISSIEFKGHKIENIYLTGSKNKKDLQADLMIEDNIANAKINLQGVMDGATSHLALSGNIDHCNFQAFGILPQYPGYEYSSGISADLNGNNIRNLTGSLEISDLSFVSISAERPSLKLNQIRADLTNVSSMDQMQGNSVRRLDIKSDVIDGSITGLFEIDKIANSVETILKASIPSLTVNQNGPIVNRVSTGAKDKYVDVILTLKPADDVYAFFKSGFFPLQDVDINGRLDLTTSDLDLEISAPYLRQGKNKLVSDTRLLLSGNPETGLNASVATCFPIKNDRASISADITAKDDKGDILINWRSKKNPESGGSLHFEGLVSKNGINSRPQFSLHVVPSEIVLGVNTWTVGEANITYCDRRVEVENFHIAHDRQYINIAGVASELPTDELSVTLADIDLSYIFDLLNINYVSFGGIASGKLTASDVFTGVPRAQTEGLYVENLAYNGAVLGDADIRSFWNNQDKEVEIHAKIKDRIKGGAKIDGGIFVTRDSLSFDMEADMVRIEFLKPFMEAFTSDVGGRASGKMKLFGNFKDIDLVGKAYADSISMKVDYTNVYYHGSDSVILNPGKIVVPGFTLHDKYGNTAKLSGYVSHRYFHDPEFEFKVSDVRSMLCYDTNPTINPDWYGTIFASGYGTIWGRPGIVAILMDMTTEAKSDFTFVLNETQLATDYTFLTFSDSSKPVVEASISVEDQMIEKLNPVVNQGLQKPSVFTMDLRATVTPEAKMTLVMDPKAGDKIVAHGGGPLQMSYDTDGDELKMYGRYTLDEGHYNFSLQDLILRDFIIKRGSNISFNGDPLKAILDITAAYRVNTNLSDLDKSFATDRDLNRTNVPVDALLNVKGDLDNPDITFDISLPTLTSDVERKVKSIISTDDLMNRQIIYLLALNRFYTPQYMGSSSNGGGELASVASSTISSQISNIIGSLTDKFTLSPSFRSDKGDFSDMEVDVSLSSRLLNNRLLINGNFGYRDRNTSQTTFVGDFDIEYLLSKNGNLRLKAYNHFNDQYYYLRSALTTQGIGVVYRKEFDNPFTFLRRRKKKEDIKLSDITPKQDE